MEVRGYSEEWVGVGGRWGIATPPPPPDLLSSLPTLHIPRSPLPSSSPSVSLYPPFVFVLVPPSLFYLHSSLSPCPPLPQPLLSPFSSPLSRRLFHRHPCLRHWTIPPFLTDNFPSSSLRFAPLPCVSPFFPCVSPFSPLLFSPPSAPPFVSPLLLLFPAFPPLCPAFPPLPPAFPHLLPFLSPLLPCLSPVFPKFPPSLSSPLSLFPFFPVSLSAFTPPCLLAHSRSPPAPASLVPATLLKLPPRPLPSWSPVAHSPYAHAPWEFKAVDHPPFFTQAQGEVSVRGTDWGGWEGRTGGQFKAVDHPPLFTGLEARGEARGEVSLALEGRGEGGERGWGVMWGDGG
ncbi:unnamed protein product [Closterium sp. NIES-64]|nr:unnamed protein product [Closterium sp. NIES-64]